MATGLQTQRQDSEDPCAGVSCGGNSACDAGSCVCTTGYTGTNCETAAVPMTKCPQCSRDPDTDRHYTSCSPRLLLTRREDPCADVTCGAHGDCVDGECVCRDDYTGPACDQAPVCAV